MSKSKVDPTLTAEFPVSADNMYAEVFGDKIRVTLHPASIAVALVMSHFSDSRGMALEESCLFGNKVGEGRTVTDAFKVCREKLAKRLFGMLDRVDTISPETFVNMQQVLGTPTK